MDYEVNDYPLNINSVPVRESGPSFSTFSAEDQNDILADIQREAENQERWIQQFNLPQQDLPTIDTSSYRITVPDDEITKKNIIVHHHPPPSSSQTVSSSSSSSLSSSSSPSTVHGRTTTDYSSSPSLSLSPGTMMSRTLPVTNPSTILETDEQPETYSIEEYTVGNVSHPYDHHQDQPSFISSSSFSAASATAATVHVKPTVSIVEPVNTVVIPERIPVDYTEGFCRNYRDAQSIATWILHSIFLRQPYSFSSRSLLTDTTPIAVAPSSARLNNTLPTGLLSGSIYSVRGLHSMVSSSSSSSSALASNLSLSNRKLFVRICVLQSPRQMGEGGSGNGNKSSYLSANNTLPFQQILQVQPDVRVNPLTARRTPIFRTTAIPGDPVTGTVTFQNDTIVTDNATNESKAEEIRYSTGTDFVCTLGSASVTGTSAANRSSSSSRRSSTWSQSSEQNASIVDNRSSLSSVNDKVSHRRGSIVQLLPSAVPIAAQLEWGYLNGYVLLQLFEERDTRLVPFSDDPNKDNNDNNNNHTKNETNVSSSSSPSANVLLGQSILRICDICAAATKPFNTTDSTLFNKIRTAHEDQEENSLTNNNEASLPTAQEFYLRLWVPLQNPKTSGSFAETNKNSSPAGKTRGNRIPPAVDVAFSLVLPYGVTVPRQMLQSSSVFPPFETTRPSTTTPRSERKKTLRKKSSPVSPRSSSPVKSSSPYSQKLRPIAIFSSEFPKSNNLNSSNNWNSVHYDDTSPSFRDQPSSPLPSHRPGSAVQVSPMVNRPGTYHSYTGLEGVVSPQRRSSGLGKGKNKLELSEIPAAVHYAPTLASNVPLASGHRNTHETMNSRPMKNSSSSSLTPRRSTVQVREESISLSPQARQRTEPLSPFTAPLPVPRIGTSRSSSALHGPKNKLRGIPSDAAFQAMASGPEAVTNYVNELKHIVGLLEHQVRTVKTNVDKKVGTVRREKKNEQSRTITDSRTYADDDYRTAISSAVTNHTTDYATTALQIPSSSSGTAATSSNSSDALPASHSRTVLGSNEWRHQVTSLQKQLQNLLDTE